jgi:hypothetical protein
METLKNFLWPIVAMGGLGAFIDFLIGRSGQEKIKDFLLEWWVKFDDVRPRNLGREDALFIASVIESWLGLSLWSRRRIIVAITFAVFSVILGTIVNISKIGYTIDFTHVINILLLFPTMWFPNDVVGSHDFLHIYITVTDTDVKYCPPFRRHEVTKRAYILCFCGFLLCNARIMAHNNHRRKTLCDRFDSLFDLRKRVSIFNRSKISHF